ncbi:YaiI/YqxD family protein [Listeria costaricensis]|uniref:YaiI/YqxD family protein n=1 Tax=Listeria costaricensis TaxID=2026604 RepID=UPI000C088C7B|nr:DUF188 domain-containing protein [Listeria costaricensis]
MQVFVDADACPVKEEILRLRDLFQLDVCFVASYNHFMMDTNGENWLFVDTQKEAVDMRILTLTHSGDIIITQDIGLSSMLLNKGCMVFSNRGEEYREQDMAYLLEIRHLHAKERRGGHYAKGPKKLLPEDKARFFETLKNHFENKLTGVDDDHAANS